MTNKEILPKINKIFQDMFDDEKLSINETTTAKDVDGWDSLAHIRIIVALEKEFHIQFSMKEMTEIHTIKNMIESIQCKSM